MTKAAIFAKLGLKILISQIIPSVWQLIIY